MKSTLYIIAAMLVLFIAIDCAGTPEAKQAANVAASIEEVELWNHMDNRCGGQRYYDNLSTDAASLRLVLNYPYERGDSYYALIRDERERVIRRVEQIERHTDGSVKFTDDWLELSLPSDVFPSMRGISIDVYAKHRGDEDSWIGAYGVRRVSASHATSSDKPCR